MINEYTEAELRQIKKNGQKAYEYLENVRKFLRDTWLCDNITMGDYRIYSNQIIEAERLINEILGILEARD